MGFSLRGVRWRSVSYVPEHLFRMSPVHTASPKAKYPKEKATLLVRPTLRYGFPKCGAEKRAKKNSPFLGLKAQTVLGQLFCLSVFQPRTLAQKKGWGEEYRVNVPLRGPSLVSSSSRKLYLYCS
jgi:hypothetical protein